MASANDTWEKNLQDPSATPMRLPLDFLKVITCDFSADRELGRGGYGVVYKGVLPSGKIIAVKKLLEIHLIDDNKFRNEVSSLMGIKHLNVVQFVGYCAETSWEAMTLQGSGKIIFAEIPARLLCFEYVSNASLDKYISDESSGLEWNMRYEIIKGICGGLHYLHEQCNIIHLDLKPENILLDAKMMPKIVDFGLSRIFGEEQTRIITEHRVGSRGYMSPEYLIHGVISTKADIFSLGVIIIEIVTGRKDYPEHFNENESPQSNGTSNQHFKEKILHIWRNRLQKSEGDTVKLEQIRVCAELGIQCTESNPGKRPITQHIIDRLDEVNIMDGSIEAGMSSTSAVAQLYSTISENMVQDQVPVVGIPASKTGIPTKDNSKSPVVPNAFRCPLSQALMKDPVMVTTGQTYDRSSITIWLNAGNDTCPVTAWKLVNNSLTPNRVLHGLIAQWCEANGLELEQPKRSAQAGNSAPAASCTSSVHDEVIELLLKLSSQDGLDQRVAAGKLRQLAKCKAENRVCIGDSGGIPILVSLLSSTDVSTQLHAVTALLNLSIYEENKARLVSSGAVPGLVQVLEMGCMEARENVAATLFSLSIVDEYKPMIGASGSIPPLVLLLSTGNQRGRKDAATALFNLCIYQDNRSKAVSAGLVPVLRELLTGSGNGMRDEALAILAILSSHPEGKAAISDAAVIPSLVGIIRNESPRNKETAAAILLHLCNGEGEHQRQHLAEAQEHGLVSLLVELAECGTDRAKRKATELLELMNKIPST